MLMPALIIHQKQMQSTTTESQDKKGAAPILPTFI